MPTNLDAENQRLRSWLQRIADLNKDGPGEAMARRAIRGMTIAEADAEDEAYFAALDRDTPFRPQGGWR